LQRSLQNPISLQKEGACIRPNDLGRLRRDRGEASLSDMLVLLRRACRKGAPYWATLRSMLSRYLTIVAALPKPDGQEIRNPDGSPRTLFSAILSGFTRSPSLF